MRTAKHFFVFSVILSLVFSNVPFFVLREVGLPHLAERVKLPEAHAAAPTLAQQGSIAAVTTGNLTVTLPTHATNDILVVTVSAWVPNTTSGTNQIAAPSGWTKLASSTLITSSIIDGEWAIFWKRAASGSETNPVFTRPTGWDTGTDTNWSGRAYVISGAETTGNPWDAAVQSSLYSTANQAVAAVTVSGTERMAVHFLSVSDDATAAGGPTATGWTTGTLVESTTGTDAGFNTLRKDNVSASTGADVTTIAAPVAGRYIYFGISFKPPANTAPTLTVTQPDGTGDTVTQGDSYNITYDLADPEQVVTVDFYYDTNSSGLDGTAITDCVNQPEGTGVTCAWNTTGVTPGSYYVYGRDVNDGIAAEVSDYSPGQITINAIPTVTIGVTAGSKATTLNSGDPNQFANTLTCAASSTCAAFTLALSSGSDSITSVKLTETGTAVAATDLSNFALYYEASDSNFSNGITGQFGTGVATSTGETVTFTGSATLTAGTTYYVYLSFDLKSQLPTSTTQTFPKGGQTVNWQIAANGDVTVSGSSTKTGAPVTLAGTTTVLPEADALTTTVGSDGRVSDDWTTGGLGGNDIFRAVTVDSQYIYLAGYENDGSTAVAFHVQKRDKASGALVTAFDGDGRVTDNFTIGLDHFRAVAVDNQYLYLAGLENTTDKAHVQKRDKTTGALVTAFDGDGRVTDNVSVGGDAFFGMVIDSQYLYLAGMENDYTAFHVQKRDKVTGALVSAFGTSGKVTDAWTAGDDTFRDIAIDSQYIYLVGYENGLTGSGAFHVQKRDKTTGALVGAFDTDGRVTDNWTTGDDFFETVAIDSQYLYLAGYENGESTNGAFHVQKRDKTTGALVTAFDTDGRATDNWTAAADVFEAVSVDSQYVYLAGYENGTAAFHVQKRDKTMGALVTAFDGDGRVTDNTTAGAEVFYGMAIDSQYLYADGYENGLTAFHAQKRKLSDGSVTATFGDGARSGDSITVSGYGFGAPIAGANREDCTTATVDVGCVKFTVGGTTNVANADITSWSNTSAVFAVATTLASDGGVSNIEMRAANQADASKITFYVYPKISAIAVCPACNANSAREHAAASSLGPQNPTTVANDAGIGTAAWTNPENATTSNDVRASVALSDGDVSNYLKATNFGFSIPSGASIAGIVAEIEKRDVNGLISDAEVRIVKGGVIGTTERSSASPWPLADGYVTHGSSTDLWGNTWTSTDINSTGFGVAIAGVNVDPITQTGSIDHIRITVHYRSDTDGLIMLSGDHFGSSAATSTILSVAATVHATVEGPCTMGGWTSTSICLEVPTAISDSLYTGSILMQRSTDGKSATSTNFRILPRIISNGPASGITGDIIQITGNHFCQSGTCPAPPNRSTSADNVKFAATLAPDADFVFIDNLSELCDEVFGLDPAWQDRYICVRVPSAAPVGSATTTVTSNTSYVSNGKAFTKLSTIPNDPTDLKQFKSDDTTQLGVGSSTPETTVILKGDISVGVSTNIALQVEATSTSATFACSGGGACSTAVQGTVGGGGACTGCTSLNDAKITLTGLATTTYHWQARVRNTATEEYSNWVSFGGNPEASTDFKPDTTGPVITLISSGTPGSNGATITWTTDEGATSQVQYNKTGTFVSNCATNNDCTVLDTALLTSHSVALNNLDSGTLYYYRVRSKDEVANETISGNNTFTTDSVTQPGKTTVFHIVGKTAGITGVATSSFSVYISESSYGIKSAFAVISGIYTTGASPSGIIIQVNGQAARTYIPAASVTSHFRIVYDVGTGNVNVDPTANVFSINPQGDTVYITSADFHVTYAYTP